MHKVDLYTQQISKDYVAYKLNNQLDRKNGPAIEFADGANGWYVNDELHREDGPAIEFADGDKEWFLNGRNQSFNEWLNKVNISPEEKTLLVLKYGK